MATANDNEQTIRTFYEAFQKRDAETMGAQYADNATFSDPAFVGLDAAQARAMWKMLCHRGKDLRVEFSNVHADDKNGGAIWDASYSFGGKRQVNNHIEAAFTFDDAGKILSHVDTFDVKKWMKMALGPAGSVMGLFPFGPKMVQKQARQQLDAWMAKRG